MNTTDDALKTQGLTLSRIGVIRRDNLRTLCEIHGTASLARKLGYRSASFISQMAGPKPTREVTEKSAREFERRLEIAEGALDTEGWDPLNINKPAAPQALMPLPAPAPVTEPTTNTSIVANIIGLIGTVSASENVAVPPLKFSEVVALAFADTMDHGGVPRESYIKQLVHLLK